MVHIQAATRGTHTGGYAWYTFRRSRLVHIQAIMPGTHSGGYAWYILARSMTPPSACSWLPSGCFSKQTATPLYQANSPYYPQLYQKRLYSAQPVATPCCTCIPSLPTDAALREPAPFPPLETNIPPRQLFRAPASSLSSCLPFQPFVTDPILAVTTQFSIFRLSYLPEATLRVYNHV